MLKRVTVILAVLLFCTTSFAYVLPWSKVLTQSISLNRGSYNTDTLVATANGGRNEILLALLEDLNGVKSASKNSFAKKIAALQINTEVKSFARTDGKICYLFGAAPWELTKNRVWFEKSTSLPLQIDIISSGDKGLIYTSYKFKDWHKAVAKPTFPAVVEQWENDVLIRSQRLEARPKSVAKPVQKSAQLLGEFIYIG